VRERRARLLAAMTEVAAEEGYAGASVARVIERAEVSRRSFYAHFGSREECFLASYHRIVSPVGKAALAIAAGKHASERPRALLAALLRGIAADPAAARIAIFEVHAAPPRVRAEHERWVRRLEGAAEGWLRGDPGTQGPVEIPMVALRGGIESIVAARLLWGEADSLPDLVDDLIAWIDSYRLSTGAAAVPPQRWEDLSKHLPAPARRAGRRPPALPRGRSALPPEAAAAERRARILEATLRTTAEHGYSAVTVSEIAAAARVTKAAFYSHFRSKQEAFLAVEALRLQESLSAAAAAFYAESEWLDRVWAGLGGLLRYLAENPDTALAGFREVHAAGEEAIRLDLDSRNAFTLFLEDGHRQRRAAGRPLPALASEAIAGANHGLIRRQVIAGGPAGVMRLLPRMTYVTAAPFVGHEAALAFIADRVEAGRRAGRGTAAAVR
jgi:AcrR family transcriptional regulator